MDRDPIILEKLVIHLPDGKIEEFTWTDLKRAFKTFREYHLRFDPLV